MKEQDALVALAQLELDQLREQLALELEDILVGCPRRHERHSRAECGVHCGRIADLVRRLRSPS